MVRHDDGPKICKRCSGTAAFVDAYQSELVSCETGSITTIGRADMLVSVRNQCLPARIAGPSIEPYGDDAEPAASSAPATTFAVTSEVVGQEQLF